MDARRGLWLRAAGEQPGLVKKELSAASRHEHLGLYDPAAIPDTFPLDPDLEAQEPKPPHAGDPSDVRVARHAE